MGGGGGKTSKRCRWFVDSLIQHRRNGPLSCLYMSFLFLFVYLSACRYIIHKSHWSMWKAGRAAESKGTTAKRDEHQKEETAALSPRLLAPLWTTFLVLLRWACLSVYRPRQPIATHRWTDFCTLSFRYFILFFKFLFWGWVTGIELGKGTKE